MKRLLRSSRLWINLVIVLALLGNPVLRQVQAHDKLRLAGLDGTGAQEDVAVELGVTPEQFHMARLQRWGTMVGAQGRVVRLRGVSPDNLQQIARQSWVQALRRLRT